MYIKELSINKLHGVYNYNIKLEKQLNLIFGENGSGKTTILEIISLIIKGEIYKLFKYKFNKIVLTYESREIPDKFNKIEIRRINLKQYENLVLENKISVEDHKKNFYRFSSENKSIKDLLLIIYDDGYYILDKREIREHYNYSFSIEQDIKREYTFLSEISEQFNYIYLPLERNYYKKIEDTFEILDEREFRDILNSNYEDESVGKVKRLVREETLRVNDLNNYITNQFRDNVLKSLIDTSSSVSLINTDVDSKKFLNLKDFISQMELATKTEEEIDSIEKTYLSILEELELIEDEGILENSKKFFKNIRQTKGQLNKAEKSRDEVWSIRLGLNELERIENIVDLAEKMERNKSIVSRPLDTLKRTLNKFLGQNKEMGKKVKFKNGKMYIETRYGKEDLSLDKLSSGERQLVIFFTNLILNIQADKTGICIVDEPESSLHLHWQGIFIDEILKINKNIQFIFATHSPELIGKYRERMIRLKKVYVGDNNE